MAENNSDQILFWLEQEPVESNIDIYLPPDTPTHRPTAKILYQINKKQELKKQRTVERLKAYHYDKLVEFRENFAETINKHNLPTKKLGFLENVNAGQHLKENIDDILSLLKDTENKSTSLVESKLTTALVETESTTSQEEEEDKLKAVDELKDEYAKQIEVLFNIQQKEIRNQYQKTLSLIIQKKENEQPPRSTIEIAPLPPLPPRVSRTDPREHLLEEHTPH